MDAGAPKRKEELVAPIARVDSEPRRPRAGSAGGAAADRLGARLVGRVDPGDGAQGLDGSGRDRGGAAFRGAPAGHDRDGGERRSFPTPSGTTSRGADDGPLRRHGGRRVEALVGFRDAAGLAAALRAVAAEL